MRSETDAYAASELRTSFSIVREGKLTLRFVGPDQKEYASVAETPARDGIFTPPPRFRTKRLTNSR